MNSGVLKLCYFILSAILIAPKASAQLRVDSTFNYSGHNILSGNGNSAFDGRKAIASSDGYVLVAGFCGATSDSLAVARFLPGGVLDKSFGSQGISVVYAGGLQISQSNIDVLVQRDRRIVVMAIGQQVTTPYSNSQFAIVLMRLNANGSKDLSFNGSGLLISRPDPNFQFTPLSLAMDSTGTSDKIYVSSLAAENGNANCPLGFGKWCISRYNTNGTPDQAFNGTGYLLKSSADIRNTATITPMALVLAIKVLPSGKLLAAGTSNFLDSFCFMFRLNANGGWDNSFGAAGRAVMPWGKVSNYLNTSAHILKDGSAVFASHTDLYSNNHYDSSVLYATKCNSDGTPASSFANKGNLTTYYKTEGHHQLSSDSNNRVLVSWNVSNTQSQYTHFQCFTSGGQPDNSFAPGGHAVIEPISHDALMYATIYHTLWTGDNKNLIVLERRFDMAYTNHLGVFKYRFPLATTAVSPTSILAEAVSVYPVPAKDQITVKTPGQQHATAYLTNMQGQIVLPMRNVTNGTTTVDVSQLARGTYFMNVQAEAGVRESRKIVLE